MKLTKRTSLALALIVCLGLVLGLIASPTAFAAFLNALVMLAAPFALGIVLARKYKLDWGIYAAGAATWVVTLIFHLLFNNYVLSPWMLSLGLSASSRGWSLLFFGLLLGLAAGLFEETGRYVVYTRFLPRVRSWQEGLMLGAGHGGVESVFFGALALYAFFQMVVLKDLSGSQLAELLSAEKLRPAEIAMEAYWSAPWYQMFLGAFERICAMLVHLCMSLLVLMSVQKKQLRWYVASLLWHTLTNATAVFAMASWGPYAAEALLLLVAGFSVLIVWRLIKHFPEPEAKIEPEQAVTPAAQPVSKEKTTLYTVDTLDESKYD